MWTYLFHDITVTLWLQNYTSPLSQLRFIYKIVHHSVQYFCVALPSLALLAVCTQVAVLLETHFTVAMDEDLRMQSGKLVSPQPTSVMDGVLNAKLAWK